MSLSTWKWNQNYLMFELLEDFPMGRTFPWQRILRYFILSNMQSLAMFALTSNPSFNLFFSGDFSSNWASIVYEFICLQAADSTSKTRSSCEQKSTVVIIKSYISLFIIQYLVVRCVSLTIDDRLRKLFSVIYVVCQIGKFFSFSLATRDDLIWLAQTFMSYALSISSIYIGRIRHKIFSWSEQKQKAKRNHSVCRLHAGKRTESDRADGSREKRKANFSNSFDLQFYLRQFPSSALTQFVI